MKLMKTSVVLESIEEIPITKLSSIPDSKNNRNTLQTHQYIKKAINDTVFIQITNQKQSEKILKLKQFGKLNIKMYPHPTLNFRKLL